VRGLKFVGLEFRDTVDTFMAPHGLPSGGDWALQKSGALLLRGTEALVVEGCLFHKIDGNAVFLGGYHRNATVSGNGAVLAAFTRASGWSRRRYVCMRACQLLNSLEAAVPVFCR